MEILKKLIATLLLLTFIFYCGKKKEPERAYLLEQVGNTAIVQVYADGFDELTLNEKILCYYLYRAAVAGRDIAYDQHHKHTLEIKAILEGILRNPEGIEPGLLKKIKDYTKLFWVNGSQYSDRTKRKIIPNFSPEELIKACNIAVKNGGDIGLKEGETVEKKIGRLKKCIFDAEFEPLMTNKNPGPGKDILTGSANNFYEGVTLKEVERWARRGREKHPLNSKVTKDRRRRIIEQVYRAGTDGIKPGLYAKELSNVIKWLEKAIPYAEGNQKETIRKLIKYFKTGDPKDFRDFNISWVKDNYNIDFINGFIEVYKDARGKKGEYEAMVSFVDKKTTKLMKDLANNALYFEQKAPWKDEYKKKKFDIPVANSINLLVGTGGLGPSSPIGINLPNEQDIRETYGSKSVLLSNIMDAARMASAAKVTDEFALPEDVEMFKKYAEVTGKALVAMHEIIGHGSGKMNKKLKEDPSTYLRENYSALEEARADLVALFNMFDDKLIEIGVLPDKKAAEAAYGRYAMSDLLILRRIPDGDKIQDDHMRATHLIVTYLMNKTGAIEEVNKNGKVYLKVKDYQLMRKGVGELLAEIMRIKAEGDYEAGKKLVNTYGIKINTEWRDNVIKRVKAINYPSFNGYVFPYLEPVKDEKGNITDVKIKYPASFEEQMLKFSEMAKE